MVTFSLDSQDINRAVAKLQKFGDVVARNRQRIAALGAERGAGSAQAAAPRSPKPHYRYSTPKATSRLRAPKGMGRIAATYYPGNLALSIRPLFFRSAKTKAYIGAKLIKGKSTTGEFGKAIRRNTIGKTDGYYLHMVERGTKYASARPFFTRSIMMAAPSVFRIMLSEWEKLTNQFVQQNTVQP